MSAGASAAAKAASIRRAGRRGPWRLLLAFLGLDRHGARVDAQAGRWEAGAIGEQRTALLLQPLRHEGWGGFYDRALPGGVNANVDFALVSPCGRFVVNVDAKLWSRKRGPVTARAGRLVHGDADRQRCMEAVRYETRQLEVALGVPVLTVIAVHSAPVAGGRFTLDGVEVMAAGLLVPWLRAQAGPSNPRHARELIERADRQLKRYVEGGG